MLPCSQPLESTFGHWCYLLEHLLLAYHLARQKGVRLEHGEMGNGKATPPQFLLLYYVLAVDHLQGWPGGALLYVSCLLH